MIRNIDGSYGFSKIGSQKPQTAFTQLKIPFSITNGVVYSAHSDLESTHFRVTASGSADLVAELFDIKIDPIFGTTTPMGKEKIKGSEIMVPGRISGSFNDPKFKPDFEGLVKKEPGKDNT